MGDKEAGAEAVSAHTRGKGDQGSMSLEDFITKATHPNHHPIHGPLRMVKLSL